MPHFSDDPGADEDPAFLSRLRIMLHGRNPAPQRPPTREERFGVPSPRVGARDPQDAALAGPDPLPAAPRRPLR
ncbi:hypothetical protein [Methylobacterium sp. CM6257]|jgi:hypothetical protein